MPVKDLITIFRHKEQSGAVKALPHHITHNTKLNNTGFS